MEPLQDLERFAFFFHNHAVKYACIFYTQMRHILVSVVSKEENEQQQGR